MISIRYGERIEETIAAVCPIPVGSSVSIGTFGVSSSVTFVVDPSATAPQIAAAQALIDSFDWSDAAQLAWETEQASKIIVPGAAVRLPADRVRSLTSFANVDGLSFQLTKDTHYGFWFDGAYNSAAAATGCQLALNGPANSFFAAGFEIATSTTAWLSAVSGSYDNGVNATGSAGATNLPFHIYGNITTTAAGLLVVRFRSETNGQAVTIKRGSMGLLKAVG